ncbi:MAG TPA: cysteine--tRNA ligase [Patescibacteria group bacterium]|nr:cysteine--tRNA ligase [Patescibacteria group bacterium]
MKLYNTLSRSIEEFEPLNPPKVGMYACGPTVYDYTHIGHLRKYINDDTLVRVLRANNYDVKHVMNITDVGHLSSDADSGEDKLEKGAKKFGKTVLEVAKFFEEDFWKSLRMVNVEKPDVVALATEHIEDQIALIEILIEKGYGYKTDGAIYFDTSKFADYGKLAGQNLEDKVAGVREDVIVDNEKRNPADFALWFFTKGRFKDHALHWDSPWGEGFPGWHIECSAMSMKYLGLSFDIHTGGIDHIAIHHPNEIAQSEAATGQPFVKYWVHYAFLIVDGQKMSKSLGNVYRIFDLRDRGYNPMAFRYLTFQSHYRSEMNFTWEALDGAQTALNKLYEMASEFSEIHKDTDIDYERDFLDAAGQDLNMPKALSIMWEMLRSNIPAPKKAATLLAMDKVLGLNIMENSKKLTDIPQAVKELVDQRNKLRKLKKFNAADQIRIKVEKMGYVIEDKERKTKITRKI